MLRHKRCTKPAIGQFSCKFKTFRTKCCQVDRKIWSRPRTGDQGFALAARKRQVIDFPVVDQAFTTCHHAYNFNDLPHALQGSVKANPMPTRNRLHLTSMVECMDTSEEEPLTPVHLAKLPMSPVDIQVCLWICLEN